MTNGEVNTGNLKMDMPATGLLLTFIYVLSVLVLFGLATITVLGTDLGQFAFWAAAGSLLLGYAAGLKQLFCCREQRAGALFLRIHIKHFRFSSIMRLRRGLLPQRGLRGATPFTSPTSPRFGCKNWV